MDQHPSRPNFVIRLLEFVPIVGFGIRCFRQERFKELALLGFNIFLAIVLAVMLWGWPAFVSVLHGAVALVGAFVFATTIP